MNRTLVGPIVALALFLGGADAASAQHAGHEPDQAKPAPADQKPPEPKPPDSGASGEPRARPAAAELPPFIPPISDEDRKAAFPDLEGHAVHDRAVNYLVLLDQLEWQSSNEGAGFNLDSKGWLGRDRDRLWFRAEGDGQDGAVDAVEAQVFYGRQFSRWWDVVAGLRQDFRPGPSRTWAAIGIQGLAPYWFEVEATAYVGASGRIHFRGEIEYELLITNRLVLQPLIEVEVFGKSDPERGLGAGLGTAGTGLRLRYEFRREIAPYLGVSWDHKFGGTADFAEAAGKVTKGARLVTGVRLWF